MAKSFFFFGLAPIRHPEDCRITSGPGYVAAGGMSKEDHERMAEVTREISKECKKDAPQTQGEFRMIVRDAVKKVGAPTQ